MSWTRAGPQLLHIDDRDDFGVLDQVKVFDNTPPVSCNCSNLASTTTFPTQVKASKSEKGSILGGLSEVTRMVPGATIKEQLAWKLTSLTLEVSAEPAGSKTP